MATLSDLNNTVLSGLNHIDALLDVGPDWNYLTPAGNVIYYTFSVTAGNEQGKTGQEAFTLSQQNFARQALVEELARITGIQFIETSDGAAAQLHFCNIDISGSDTTGLCSWRTGYSYDTNNSLVAYDADAYIYLDNNEWYAQNRNLTPGGYGYETLLHELGHALGLKHPHEGSITLDGSVDNTSNTLMSYRSAGGPYQHFNQDDVAALNWLYGGDGLRGELGINSATGARYFTGTNMADTLKGTEFNDTLEGAGGNDYLDGGFGIDTARFTGPRSAYTITALDGGLLRVSGGTDGTDTLANIEVLDFMGTTYSRAQVVDSTPPLAPTLNVARNANGYAHGNAPLVTGAAEANSTVKLYLGDQLLGSTVVDGTGLWSMITPAIADGYGYTLRATATDSAGNTSPMSAAVSFSIDATPPAIPSGTVSLVGIGNQPVFSGTAEANTTIQLVRISDAVEIGRATVGGDGTWRLDSAPLPNGSYEVGVVSVDIADNATSAAQRLNFNVLSPLNQTGTAAADIINVGSGNNAIDGQGGVDIARYAGARAGFTVKKEIYGFSVVDNAGDGGRDTLVNVERVNFSGDNKWLALDLDGVGGKVFRLYQAAFDRPAEAAGQGYWIWRMEAGTSLKQIALEFTKQPEFAALYGTSPTDLDFIQMLYKNVLHRAPDEAGKTYWLDAITKQSREDVLVFFSESPENQAQVIGSIQGGIEFTPWA